MGLRARQQNPDDTCKTLLHILRVIEATMPPLLRRYAGTGRKPYQYQPFVRSILAKCFFKIARTTELLQRLKADSNLRLLCGFDVVPGKSTFSRNLGEVSGTAVMSETREHLVQEAHEGKVVYQVNRDSTAIAAREKVEKRPFKEERNLKKQVHETAEESLKHIDTACAHGCKKNRHGNTQFWTGYTLHLDVSDTGFPLIAFVSRANVHDTDGKADGRERIVLLSFDGCGL